MCSFWEKVERLINELQLNRPLRIEEVSIYALNVGDEIKFERLCGLYDHHAVVVRIDLRTGTITTKGWSSDLKKFWKPRIKEEKLHVKDLDRKNIIKVVYSDSVLNANPPEIVLQRAEHYTGNPKYNLFTNNCESFTTFCKTGTPHTRQGNRCLILFRLSLLFLRCPSNILWVFLQLKQTRREECGSSSHPVHRLPAVPPKHTSSHNPPFSPLNQNSSG